jgi:hypothetical protein
MRIFGSVCPSAKTGKNFDRTPQQREEVVAAYLSDVFVVPIPASMGHNIVG